MLFFFNMKYMPHVRSLLVASAVLSRQFSKIDTSNNMNYFKLIIIGSGASGMAAAAELLKSDFTDFRILEAENRKGGRINTITLGDIPIELGAEWIHGESGNIVYELASKYDLANKDSKDFGSFIDTNFYDFSGHLISKDISLALTTAYYDIMNTGGKDLSKDFLNGSVGNYLEFEFQKVVNNLRNNLNIDSDLCKKFLKTFENWENSIDASHSWYETSLSGHLEYWECDGVHLIEWKNNQYKTLFDLLAKSIMDPEKQQFLEDKITFNKEVIKIIWNKECKLNIPNVKLECLDGSVYYADYVLVTCSLGVLKDRASKMFFPSLPLEKLNCIENLGFGTVDKIFLKFEYQWWKNDFNGYAFLWSDEERKNDLSGWLNGVVCFHPIDTKSPILRGWVTGEAAQLMETLTNVEVSEGINYLFNKFLGSSIEVLPVEVCVVSKWYTNPHFRGSYSCRLMKSEASNVWASQLAQTIFNVNGKPVLFFGGEATHDHYFSTVHGAVEAGQREARKLLQAIIKKPKIPKYAQVVIVGAGISGLAAAKTLIENGVSDVIILEAQSEPGGRIRSLQVGDYSLEFGAQWIHGDKNEVFTFCQENDLLTDEYSAEGEGFYFRENGEQIDENLVKEVDDVIKNILENCEKYVLSKEKISWSIGEELSNKFNEYLDSCIQDTEELKTIKKELFDWHVRFQLIDNSCSDLFHLSAKAWGLFKFCGGNDYVNFKNGYSSLINTIVNCLPQNVLHCDISVQRIDWLNDINIKDKNVSDFYFKEGYSAKVTTSNGSSIYSQYVIVTSSLGYLKINYKTMFYPPLPTYLSEAIESLEFGVIDKIFLIYEKPWWDPNVKGFQLVWSNEESFESEQHWARFVTGFDVIIKEKPILLGWVGGKGAIRVEQIPEDEVGHQVTELLRRFTKNPKIPFPEKVLRTKWWCNEYVKGAYSHISIKCDKSEISCSNLAEPVYSVVHTKAETFRKPTVLLAGESTHKNHFSTVHGAYESGQGQARVILEHIQGRNKE